ncbi:MAG: arsenate reductase (glutaredoxin) [Mariprofundaceae bacterium]|nr:arsenate reductase (glutaredoxin) [Mariprofundaceae bacterium]
MSVQIFYNLRCSKCRITLQLLKDEQGIEPEVIEYLKTPPTLDVLTEVVRKLGIQAIELIRFNEKVAKELKINASDDKSDAQWLAIMVENPILIERPIVIKGDQAVIGRPPSKVLELF